MATVIGDVIPVSIQRELQPAADRAVAAGAAQPLTYIGAGMYGIVFCDPDGYAYKVFRTWKNPRCEAIDEAEWFRDINRTQAAPYLPVVVGVDIENAVLVRECVQGRPGRWSDNLPDLHMALEPIVEAAGWTMPEFKDDSWIKRENGGWTIIDASFALRRGKRLASYIRRIIAGEIPPCMDTAGMAHAVEIERGRTLSDEEAAELSDMIHRFGNHHG